MRTGISQHGLKCLRLGDVADRAADDDGQLALVVGLGVVLAGGADDKLRYAVKANELLSLWTYDADMHISLVG